ncbi:hypothetical protein DSO57_1008466 [Entomophthora muscae]|uniref:Uncharacterized protein n=1 Tax=Entomophthora muscae TaxID=34485 RepID=A0ACC2U5S5_9FUNG|nr:hypothetical protein DSO57_1008466 [Entomophthora muscae]
MDTSPSPAPESSKAAPSTEPNGDSPVKSTPDCNSKEERLKTQLTVVMRNLVSSSNIIKSYQLKSYELQELNRVLDELKKRFKALASDYRQALKEKEDLAKTCDHLKTQYDLILEKSNKYLDKEVFIQNEQLLIRVASLEESKSQLEHQNFNMRTKQKDTHDLSTKVTKLQEALVRAENRVKDREETLRNKASQLWHLSEENKKVKLVKAQLQESNEQKEQAIAKRDQFEHELSKIRTFLCSIDPSIDNELGEDFSSVVISKLKTILAKDDATDKEALAREYQDKLEAAEKKNFEAIQVMEEEFKAKLSTETRALQLALTNAKDQNELLTKKMEQQRQANESVVRNLKAKLEHNAAKPLGSSPTDDLLKEQKALTSSLQVKLAAETTALKESVADADTQKKLLAETNAALIAANKAIQSLTEEINCYKLKESVSDAPLQSQELPSANSTDLKHLEEELAKKSAAFEEASANILCLQKEVDAFKAKAAAQSMLELEALMNEKPLQDSHLKEELILAREDKDNIVQSFEDRLKFETASLEALLKEANDKSCKLEMSLSNQISEQAKTINVLKKELDAYKLKADPKEKEALLAKNTALLKDLQACKRELNAEKDRLKESGSNDQVRCLTQQLETSRLEIIQLKDDKALADQQLCHAHRVSSDNQEELSNLKSTSVPLPKDQQELVAILNTLLETPHIAPDFKDFLQKLIQSTNPNMESANFTSQELPAGASQEIARLTHKNKQLLAKYSQLKESSGNATAEQLRKIVDKNKRLSSENKRLLHAKSVLQDSLTDHMMQLSKLKANGRSPSVSNSPDSDNPSPSSPFSDTFISDSHDTPPVQAPHQPSQGTMPQNISHNQPKKTAPKEPMPSQLQNWSIVSNKRTAPDSTSKDRPFKRHVLEKHTDTNSSELSNHQKSKATLIQHAYPYNPRHTIQTNISNAVNKFPADGQLFSTCMAKFKHLQGQDVATAIVSLIHSHSNDPSPYTVSSLEISYCIDESSYVAIPPDFLHSTAFPEQGTLDLILNELSRELVSIQANPTLVICLGHIFAALCKLAQDTERMRVLLYDILAYGSKNQHLLLSVSSLSQVWGLPFAVTPDSSDLCLGVFQAIMVFLLPMAQQFLGPAVAASHYDLLVKNLGWRSPDNAIPLDQILLSLLKGYEDPHTSSDMKMIILRLISLIHFFSKDDEES